MESVCGMRESSPFQNIVYWRKKNSTTSATSISLPSLRTVIAITPKLQTKKDDILVKSEIL